MSLRNASTIARRGSSHALACLFAASVAAACSGGEPSAERSASVESASVTACSRLYIAAGSTFTPGGVAQFIIPATSSGSPPPTTYLTINNGGSVAATCVYTIGQLSSCTPASVTAGTGVFGTSVSATTGDVTLYEGIDDNNPCTVDGCKQARFFNNHIVTHTAAVQGASCDDGNSCNGADTCNANGACAQHTGNLAAGTSCGSNACAPQVCDGAGACSAPEPISFNSNDPCTVYSCDPIKGVIASPRPNAPASCSTAGASAPPLDSTRPAAFRDQIGWLVGAQQGLDSTKLDSTRLAVIRGRLLARDLATPLAGIQVSLLGHGELGVTTTQGDGTFNIVANGGEKYTVVFSDTSAQRWGGNYLTVQRSAVTRWNAYTVLDDAVMIQPAPSSPAAITFDPVQYVSVQGPTVTDADGTRTATLIFPPGTRINEAPGSTTFHVHATEYTIDPAGQPVGVKQMPADLPANSGYTYAAEFSVEELAGSPTTTFNQPVISYVDNFVFGGNLSPGDPVPTGFYDRVQGKWLANAEVGAACHATGSGTVVRFGHDANGNPTLDSGGKLADVQPGELAALAALPHPYPDGTLLWRVKMTHFSPWDMNWGVAPPPGAAAPNPGPATADNVIDDACHAVGSIIECQNQILAEEIPIAGTPYSLRYQSERTRDRNLAITIPINGAKLVPSSARVMEVWVNITIGGKTHQIKVGTGGFDIQPYQTVTYVWDRLDAFGRYLPGPQFAEISVAYEYPAQSVQPTEGFGDYGGKVVTGTRGARSLLIWSPVQYLVVGSFDASGLGLGGFSVSAHHVLDQSTQTLYYGDGRRKSVRNLASTIATLAGKDNCSSNTSGDGGPATLACTQPFDIASSPDGSYVYSDYLTVRRVDGKTGAISTIAGRPYSSGSVWSADGAQASTVPLSPDFVALGPDGSVYLTQGAFHNAPGPNGTTNGPGVRRVWPDGTLQTVVGFTNNGTQAPAAGFGGDGCSATSPGVALQKPSGIHVDLKGALYIADAGNYALRKVDAPRVDSNTASATAVGMIHTIAGRGPSLACLAWQSGTPYAEGQLATTASVQPVDVTVGKDGVVYFYDACSCRVAALYADGTLHTVVGAPGSTWASCGGAANGAIEVAPVNQAVFATNGGVSKIALADDGSMYLMETASNVVRVVTSDGYIRRFAGQYCFGGNCTYPPSPNGTNIGDGGPALAGIFGVQTRSVAAAPDGSVLVADSLGRVRRVSKPVNPTADADEFFAFDASGRHVDTYDRKLGVHKTHFDYDSSNRVVAITDTLQSTATRIAYNGSTVTITAPHGQTTTLTLANGYLQKVTNPNGETWTMTYQPAQPSLLRTLTDPKDATEPGMHTHTFGFDASGLLTSDISPTQAAAGNSGIKLSRVDNGFARNVTFTSGEGHTTMYYSGAITDGSATGWRDTVTSPSGAVSSRDHRANGIDVASSYGGESQSQTVMVADPRFGAAASYPSKVTTSFCPGGGACASPLYQVQVSRAITGSTYVPGHPELPLTETTSSTIAGKTTTRQLSVVLPGGQDPVAAYASANRTVTVTTPMGRSVQSVIDPLGRVLSTQVNVPSNSGNTALAPTTFAYDAQAPSHLTSVTVNGATPRTTRFGYYAQDTGFLQSTTDALGRPFSYARDPIGRPNSIGLPDGTSIGIGYDLNGNTSSVTPPGKPTHSLGYNGVDLRTSYTAPSVTPVQWAFDNDRKPRTMARPDGTLTVQYDGYGRVSGSRFGDSGGTTHSTSVAYDAVDRLASASSDSGVVLTPSYVGPLVTSTNWTGLFSASVSTQFDPTHAMAVSSRAVGGTTVQYGYDDDGLLVQTSVSGLAAASFAIPREKYTGLPVSAANGGTTIGALAESWTFNEYGEPTGFTSKVGSNVLYGVAYVRDALGRVTSKTETLNGTTLGGIAYAYDAQGRLLRGATSANTYDANGNRNDASGSFVYDTTGQDQLQQYTSTDPSHGFTQLVYTAYGDLLTKNDLRGTSQFTYDVLGNLRSASVPTLGGAGKVLVQYGIDALNRRVQRTVSVAGNPAKTQSFVFQDALRPIAELDGSGGLRSVFVYGTRSNVPDYVVQTGKVYRLLSDNVGSVRLVVDVSNGTVVDRIDYDDWGRITYESSPPTSATAFPLQPFGFAGGMHDRVTGLVRFGARDYDPEQGRWTTRDASGLAGGLNLYAYANQDPVDYVDSDGHNPILILVAAGFLVVNFGSLLESDDAGRQRAANPGLAAGGISSIIASVGMLSGVGAIPGAFCAVTTPDIWGASTAGAARPRVLQSGGRTIAASTARGLNEALGRNLSAREWGRALEALKNFERIGNASHNSIDSVGNYISDSGEIIGNLEDFLE